jgi:hypothetical protein
MSMWKTVAMVAAVTGCAGVQRTSEPVPVSGVWVGEIEWPGGMEEVAFDLKSQNGTYRGEVRSLEYGSEQLENVAVRGDLVELNTGNLRFEGRVEGSRLWGTVSENAAKADVAAFSVTQEDPLSVAYDPAPEWAPPVLP